MVRDFLRQREHRITETSVYRALFATSGLSKNQLAKQLGGSRSSISRLLYSLEDRGAVTRLSSRGGPDRSDIYMVVDRSLLSIGAFLGPNAYGVGLVDASGQVIDRSIGSIHRDTSPDDAAAAISTAVETILNQNNLHKRKDVLGLGLSTVGPLWKRRGVMVKPFHLVAEDWNYVPIAELVAMRTGLPTSIDTIAEAALSAEVIFGRGKDAESAAYVWFDEGIGTSLYVNGVLGVGEADLSYTLGHLVIELDGRRCVCGRQGCLETYASLPSIYAEVENRLSERGLDLPDHAVDSRDLSCVGDSTGASLNCSDALMALQRLEGIGKAILDEVIYEASKAVAVALTNFVHLTQPRLLLYGGKTIEAFPQLLDQLPEHIGQLQTQSYQASCQLSHCDFSDESVIVGSALLPINEYVGLLSRTVSPGVFDLNEDNTAATQG